MSEITFVLASCQYPAGLFDREPAMASAKLLSDHLDSLRKEHRPACLLLVGDQVYVDATAGLFDPTVRYDRFERPHENLFTGDHPIFGSPRLPIYMMMDDHEIVDNWEPIHGDAAMRALMVEGRKSYFRWQRRAGPDPLPPSGDSENPVHFPFSERGFRFFMADTRTERTPRTAEGIESARIMSETQFAMLKAFLENSNRESPPRFVASPSILLPRRLRAARGCPASAIRSDAWDGYPASFHALLAHIADQEIRNAVFLSGDEHISLVTRARVTNAATGKCAVIHSVHSSPLYAPYPFANSMPEELKEQETFSFQCGDHAYGCDVEKTEFGPPGDGFAILRVYQNGGAWRLACDFRRATASPQIDWPVS